MSTKIKNTAVYTLKIRNCLDCPHHKVVADPGVDDFDYDDVKATCGKRRGRRITGAERPYDLRDACGVPDWCPLLAKE